MRITTSAPWTSNGDSMEKPTNYSFCRHDPKPYTVVATSRFYNDIACGRPGQSSSKVAALASRSAAVSCGLYPASVNSTRYKKGTSW